MAVLIVIRVQFATGAWMDITQCTTSATNAIILAKHAHRLHRA